MTDAPTLNNLAATKRTWHTYDSSLMDTRFQDLPFKFDAFATAYAKECMDMIPEVLVHYPDADIDCYNEFFEDEVEEMARGMMIDMIEQASDVRDRHEDSEMFNMNTFLEMFIDEFNGMGLDDGVIMLAMERAIRKLMC